MTTVDWNKLRESAQTTVLPDGTYDLRVKSVKVAKAKKLDPTTGEPKNMLKARFEVVSGPSAGYSDLYDQLTISPESSGAMIIFFRQLAVLGADAAFMASNPTLEQVAERITGAYLTAEVGHREWGGAPRNELSNYQPFSGQVPQAVPQAGVPQLPPQGQAAPQYAPPAPMPVPQPAPAPTPAQQPVPLQPQQPAQAPPF